MALVIDNLLGNDNLSQLGKPYVEANVDVMNTQKRLPSTMLIDTSGSMRFYKDLLKKSVEGVYDAILNDRKASNVTELGVMTFSSEIRILEKMCEIRSQTSKGRNFEFECEGLTLTGLAIKAALAHLEARKEVYKEKRTKFYAPILFFISDGKPECPEEIKAQEQKALLEDLALIRREVAANRLVVISVEIGKYCNHDLMVQLTGLNDDKHVIKVNDGTEFAQFFKLSSSVIISSSQTGTERLNSYSFKDEFNNILSHR